MKKIFLLFTIVIAISSCAQTTKTVNTVPAELLTNDSTAWTISTPSTVGYVNTTSGPGYNSYKSGGGMIVKFKFKENGRFEFLLYVQENTYGIDNETWTQFEGTVEFKKDAKGQQVFVPKLKKERTGLPKTEAPLQANTTKLPARAAFLYISIGENNACQRSQSYLPADGGYGAASAG